MTIKELFSYCSDELFFTECGDFEALCIFNDVLGFSKEQILLNNQSITSSHQEKIDHSLFLLNLILLFPTVLNLNHFL